MDRLMDWKGRVLRRRYRLDERVAVGRTVEVFRAFDILEEKEVAVKLPLPHLISDRDFCDSFRSAAHRATRLSHPGVIPVLDYGIEDNRPYAVTEMVEEKTLHELLAAGKRMKPVGALYFAVEMGRILAYLHGQGIVHGSLDERHVFIYPGRRARVSDPGFPVVLGGAASPHPFYQDPRRDLSDLGYLLYRSLTGRGAAEAVADVREGRLRWGDEVPPRLRRLVQLCLDSVAGAGFPSSDELVMEAVSTLREEAPMMPEPRPEAGETGRGEEAARPAPAISLPRLKRWQVWLGAAMLAVAVIFFLVWILSIAITGSKVEVPNLVNVSVEEARKLAAERDLGMLVVAREYDAGVRAGYVISQDPKGGVMVKRKTVVKVLESLGPLTVPNLVGLTLEDARLVLESRGFRVGEVIYREVEGYSENRVVETDPPYGSRLSSGAAVNLVVNRKASGI